MYELGDKIIAIANLPLIGVKIGDVFEVKSASSVDDNVVLGITVNGKTEYVSDVFMKDVDAIRQPEVDEVNSPSHYTDGGIEVIDYIEAKLTPEQFKGYLLGNVIKYISRYGKKTTTDTDLEKANVYLNWLLTRP